MGAVRGRIRPEDIAAVYRLIAEGRLRPRLTEIAFDDVPDGLRRLRAGEVADRLVMVGRD